MSVKKLETKKVENVVVKPVMSQVEKEAEALRMKAIADQLNSDKINKDVRLKTIEELIQHEKFLRERISEVTRDYEVRKKVLDSVHAGIQAAQYEESTIRARFEKQNAKLVENLNKKMEEVTSADGKLQALIAENEGIRRELKVKLSNFEQERVANFQKVAAITEALHQNQSEMSKLRADMEEREKALAEAVTALEKEKAEIAPEYARITAIKNENQMLYQKAEMDKRDADGLRLTIQNERRLMEEKVLSANATVKQQMERIANEDARLRKWEQDLKDAALEIRAQQEEVHKVLRREKLERDVKASEEAREKK